MIAVGFTILSLIFASKEFRVTSNMRIIKMALNAFGRKFFKREIPNNAYAKFGGITNSIMIYLSFMGCKS